MKKNRAQRDILYISISSFVLVALWVGFNIYHAAVTSTIAPDLELQIQPIDKSFDTNTIEKLKTREKTSPVYELNTASNEATPTQSPISQTTPTQPIATGSAIQRPGQ